MWPQHNGSRKIPSISESGLSPSVSSSSLPIILSQAWVLPLFALSALVSGFGHSARHLSHPWPAPPPAHHTSGPYTFEEKLKLTSLGIETNNQPHMHALHSAGKKWVYSRAQCLSLPQLRLSVPISFTKLLPFHAFGWRLERTAVKPSSQARSVGLAAHRSRRTS